MDILFWVITILTIIFILYFRKNVISFISSNFGSLGGYIADAIKYIEDKYNNLIEGFINSTPKLFSSVIFIILLTCYIGVIYYLFTNNVFQVQSKHKEYFVVAAVLGIYILLQLIILTYPDGANKSFFSLFNKTKGAKDILVHMFTLIIIIGIITWITYFIEDYANSYTIDILLNIILLLVTIGIFAYIFKIFKINIFNTDHTHGRLFTFIARIIFYIPCLIVWLIEEFKMQYKITTKTTLIIFLIEIVLIVLYFLIPFIYKSIEKRNKTILLESPIYINNETEIGTYKKLKNMDSASINYNYALSAMFYINPQPISSRPSVNKYMSILNYGDKPNILYNGSKNKIQIKVNKKTVFESEVQLQKWNSIIINYKGGVIDVFLNKKLITSQINIPYISTDRVTVGANNGISGGIRNVYYYNNTLSLDEIIKI